MTPEIVRKIEVGDNLTDDELLRALAHYTELTRMLRVLGPRFYLAFCECNRVANDLNSYATHRGLL